MTSSVIRVAGDEEVAEWMSADTYCFGDVEVDLATEELRREGQPVAIEPRAMQVLMYLIRHRSRLVYKTELLDKVWGDRFVSESALSSQIGAVRSALGDDGLQQTMIRTIYSKGFRFVAEIDAQHQPPSVAAVSEATAPGWVSPPVNPSIGRDELIQRVDREVADWPVVTLLGPAGVGKTHLARHSASVLGDRFQDGAWFVSLAKIEESAGVAQAVLDALDRRRAPGAAAEDVVVGILRNMPCLLVLDNCEHLIDAVAHFVRQLQDTGSQASVLATSRQRLGVPGERIVEVGVLDPEHGLQLFRDRAAAAGVEFDGDDEAVRSVCRRLDFLPLALELAAPHVRTLGLGGLVATLDDRLDLLQGAAGGDRHHKTLEQAISWSYENLDFAMQRTMCRFSVFAGSFDLEAAATLASVDTNLTRSEAVQHLLGLAERSLIVVEGDPDERSYRLLESIRLFSQQRLGDETAAAELAHVNYYVGQAERQLGVLESQDFGAAFFEVPKYWDNYSSAMNYAIDRGLLDEARRLLDATVEYAHATQRLEHADWAERLLAFETVDQPLPEVRAHLARFVVLQDFDRAAELVADVDPELSLGAMLSHCWMAVFAADFEQRQRILALIEKRFRGSGGLSDLAAGVWTMFLLTSMEYHAHDARAWVVRAATPAGRFGRAFVSLCESRVAYVEGEYQRALDESQSAITYSAEANVELVTAAAYRCRAQALVSLDDHRLAARLMAESMAAYARQGLWIAVVADAPLAAQLLHRHRDHEAAANVLSVFFDAGLQGSWSTEVAELLALALASEHPEIAPKLDPRPPASMAEFADTIVASLDRLAEGSGG